MEKEISKMNIYEKILLVSSEVRNIEKNTIVGAGTKAQYKAVSDLDVTLAVKDAESKFRLLSFPVNQEIISSDIVTTKDNYGNERTQYVVDIQMTLRIINIDNPTETMETVAFGKGIDTGDKGFGKASTYARKYCLLNAYKIATGEDPDKDMSPETAPKRAQKKSVTLTTSSADSMELELTRQTLKECATIEDLGRLFSSIGKEYQNILKDEFTAKKNEIKSNSI